jgi:hypothetical protein
MQLEQVEDTTAHTTGGRPSFATSGVACLPPAQRCLVCLCGNRVSAPSAPGAQPPHSMVRRPGRRPDARRRRSMRPFPINVPDEAPSTSFMHRGHAMA